MLKTVTWHGVIGGLSLTIWTLKNRKYLTSEINFRSIELSSYHLIAMTSICKCCQEEKVASRGTRTITIKYNVENFKMIFLYQNYKC